ncbi:hypothetical protein ABZW47_32445 [Streptomyces sp. NPDC004549]|uniref:hypothetical protein n=1 Tax=Streptomyces sp. NPDC004549 TaxID=3154283 RepID=UPI00339FDB58
MGAADLLANWKTVRSPEMAADVLPDTLGPDELWAFTKQYGERSRARIADVEFAMKNGIVPVRLQD